MGIQNAISTNKLSLLLTKPMAERLENASLNTLLGLLVVFAVLIIITLIIYMFRIFPYLQSNKSGKQEEQKNTTVDTVIEQIIEKEENEFIRDDYELIAVITAAISAVTGDTVPADGLIVRSIRRVNKR